VIGEPAPVRVLLADEQSLFREAVTRILEIEEDLHVVADAHDGPEALAEAERTLPDVALLDAGLPGWDGIRTTALIKERVPRCRVVVLSAQADDHLLVRALEAGASGYVTKDSPLAELIDAMRAVNRGETLVPPRMLGALVAQFLRRRQNLDRAFQRMSRLTRREREVLRLLIDGVDNDTMGRALVISPETARTHVQNILTKLDVHSRLEAVAFARQSGLLEDLVEA